MPRLPRATMVAPNQVQHVVLRGNNRRRLFSYAHDYRFFLRLLDSAQATLAVVVHAYCLMPNHVHLIVTPQDSRVLASFVKRVAQRFAQHRNRDGRGSGKLFEQRYFSARVESERHLAIATMYVELNPVRAGIVADAKLYKWSSARAHLGGVRAQADSLALWVPTPWYLALGGDAAARAQRYAELVHEASLLDRDALREELAWRESVATRAMVRRPNRGRAA